MFTVDLNTTIEIPRRSAVELIADATGENLGWKDLQLDAPSPEELAEVMPLSELEIPWDVPFAGYRLSKFNGGPIRMLERRNGTVTWSRILDKEHKLGVYRHFLEAIKSAVTNWARLRLYEDGETVRYDLDTCANLLKETFRNSQQPRLVPKFEWPDRETCIDIIKTKLGPPPWRYEDYSGSLVAKMDGAKFRFEARGERGELEGGCVEADLNAFYLHIFKFVVRYDYFLKDENFVANWFYFSDEMP